jgi:2-dehydro-3-deoxy-D-arabinonate dehydratase
MHIVRYVERAGGPTGLGTLDDGQVTPVDGLTGFADLLALDLDEARARLDKGGSRPALALERVLLLPPADGLVEVWASGVTYERSMDARVEESQVQDVYTRVYAAERPELFFKAPSWRVVTDGEPVAVRPDSAVTVPEPELALVITSRGQILGYTVCNDMSSRDIEGANPLYIPQAKTYAGSCALAAAVRPAWEVADVGCLQIRVDVARDGASVFAGETSTARLHRPLRELVDYLVRAMEFPAGAVLATGTGIVPELDFTLLPGDRVDITIEEVGTLSNPVSTVEQASGWPVAALTDPLVRLEVR